MVDTRTAKQRSRIMSRIRGKDTRPEMRVRRIVYGLGYRYRLHRKDLPGQPDLALAGRRKVIFVHGCFWHQHEGCRRGQLPKSNLKYWGPKLEENKRRDLANQLRLKDMGWEALVVWECETKNIFSLQARIEDFLENSGQSNEY